MKESEKIQRFWEFVEQYREDESAFELRAETMDESELVELFDMYESAVADLKGEVFDSHWEGHSEDYIDGTASDIVRRGKEFYERVLAHPELIPTFADDDPSQDGRGFLMEVYERRFGRKIWQRS